MKTLLTPLILLCTLMSTQLFAEPWIDTSDIYLKADIQQLADAGYILTPVTTYPLMWDDVINDLKKIEINHLSTSQQSAYYYISHQFKLARRNLTTIKVQSAAKNSRFTSFGDIFRDKNSIQIQSSSMSNNFAMKIAPSYTYSPIYGEKYRLDESYLAAFWGNWVISIGQQDRWFGPTWDTSLSLSNNARPMPALAITRKSAKPFTLPFTELMIPWTLTTFIGKMDDRRIIKNTLLWGFRLNFKPFKNLEVGITRLAQWGGKGHAQNFSTFWNVLIGRTNCGAAGLTCNANNPNPANQQAGYDLRYSTHLFTQPISIYGQYYAEDGDNKHALGFLSKPEIQLGLDTHLDLFNMPTTTYIEYTNSFADCQARDGIGNCFNEHSSYKTGMRYNGRAIGNLYDNDAQTVALGAISQFNRDTQITTKFRWLKLNYDNSDLAPQNTLIGNPLTSIAENILMVSTSIQFSYKQWRFTLETKLSQSSFVNNIGTKTNANAAFSLEYNL